MSACPSGPCECVAMASWDASHVPSSRRRPESIFLFRGKAKMGPGLRRNDEHGIGATFRSGDNVSAASELRWRRRSQARSSARRCSRRLGKALAVRVHRDLLRCDRDAGLHVLEAVDHDDVARGEPARDDAKPVDARAELDRPVLERVVRFEREHELLAEIGADRALVDENRVALLRADELDACEQARREAAVPCCRTPRGRGSCPDCGSTWLSTKSRRPACG